MKQTAQSIRSQYCDNQIIFNNDNNQIVSYIPKAPKHDVDADQISLGTFVYLNNTAFRTSSCFGVYFENKISTSNVTIKQLKNHLFKCPGLLPNVHELYKEVQIKVFDKDNKFIKHETDEYAIPFGYRVEIRFGCTNWTTASRLYNILREFSSIKDTFGKHVQFYAPVIKKKENRYSIKDFLSYLLAHAREVVVNDDELHDWWVWVIMHFDTIGHKHGITPLDG